MRAFSVVVLAVVAVVSARKHHHTSNELVEPILPKLSEHQRKSLAKFEDKTIFAHVWADAGKRLQAKMAKIEEKAHPHFRHRHQGTATRQAEVDEYIE